jgi:signal transduction histidine kinase
MFRTLYSKLAAVLLGLFALVGAGAVFGTLHVLSLYHLESSQQLNRTLARHLAEQNLLANLSDANAGRLRGMFDMQMIINPAIQIYLLDVHGTIVAHSAPPGEVKVERVALDPVQAFLAPGGKFPVFGDDPRRPGRRRIFSVAQFPADGRPEGYLYVVLADPVHERPARLLSQSYVIKLAVAVALASVLLALLVGLAVFALITRKLRQLADGVERFQATDFSQRPQLPPLPDGRSGDEIDRLGASLRDMAARIASQVQRLKQNDVLRRELVANVSHDLKTPLATLQGYVDTLLLKDDSLAPAERRHYLGVASRSCQRLSKLVADLIELAKLDAHEVTPQPEPFSPGELLQDVAQKFQLKAQQRHVALETVLPEGVPYVSADIGLIERVLENLIGNALAHTDAGGTVRLTLDAADGEAVLRVSDTGCGIPAEEIPHVFERFYRVNGADWEQGGNAGLGLAITKSILDLHGSEMTVESQVGVGTSFAFTLPAARLEVASRNGC